MTDTGDGENPSNFREVKAMPRGKMAIRQKGGKKSPTAQRIRILRAALFNENSTQFARRVGISPQRMGNFENGFPLPLEAANRIRAAAPGITLDWLIHGDERMIPFEMLTKLRSEEAKVKGSA